jgi:hypothetical protein
MNRASLQWYELLGRCLIWVAGIVLLLSAIGAIVIGSSSTTVPILSDIQQQGQGIAAIAALGSGLTASGLLAGVGAILRLLATNGLSDLGPAPEDSSRPATDDSATDPEQLSLAGSRRRERDETRRRERQ